MLIKSRYYNLIKSLYKLKQAPRSWNKRIASFLIKLGFNKCTSKYEVYVRDSSEQNQIITCLYADDLLLSSSNEDQLTKFKGSMENEFEMSYLENLTYFLGNKGIEFSCNKRNM